MVEITAFDEAIVDEEELPYLGFSGSLSGLPT